MAVLNTESRHVQCLQDSTGVQLHTKVDTIEKETFLFPCTGAAGELHPWKAFTVTLRISYLVCVFLWVIYKAKLDACNLSVSLFQTIRYLSRKNLN